MTAPRSSIGYVGPRPGSGQQPDSLAVEQLTDRHRSTLIRCGLPQLILYKPLGDVTLHLPTERGPL